MDQEIREALLSAKAAIHEAARLACDINNDDLSELFNEGGSMYGASRKISSLLDSETTGA